MLLPPQLPPRGDTAVWVASARALCRVELSGRRKAVRRRARDAKCAGGVTFLLKSALGKERILEVYLNIIEWGPYLRGPRPAPISAETAFVVAIIPGPIKYQSSFAHGTPGPGLRSANPSSAAAKWKMRRDRIKSTSRNYFFN